MSKVDDLEAKHVTALAGVESAKQRLEEAETALDDALTADSGADGLAVLIRARGKAQAARTALDEAERKAKRIERDLETTRAAELARAEAAAWRESDKREARVSAAAEALLASLRPAADRFAALVTAMEEYRIGLPKGGASPPMGWAPAMIAQMAQLELSRASNKAFPNPIPFAEHDPQVGLVAHVKAMTGALAAPSRPHSAADGLAA